jgi:hypothetical protein
VVTPSALPARFERVNVDAGVDAELNAGTALTRRSSWNAGCRLKYDEDVDDACCRRDEMSGTSSKGMMSEMLSNEVSFETNDMLRLLDWVCL